MSASDDGTLKLWHVVTGECRATWTGHEGEVTACSFAPDGQHALSASEDGTLRFWHVASGQPIRTHRIVAGEHAVWSADRTQLLDASAGAWRWLAAQIVDEQQNIIDLWPAESLVSLPLHASTAAT